jgi:predicted Zn-dependent protease
MILHWKPFFLCCTVLTLSSPLLAQRVSAPRVVGGGGGNGGTSTVGSPSVFSQPQPQPNMMQPIPDAPLAKPTITEDEACMPWSLSQIRGATVSVLRLQVPDKARSEYEKACGDFRKKKMGDAEQHVRTAIERYSNYVAAWVMLGQVLAAQEQADKAHEACSHANTADPTYLPPYLCLAELDARSGDWEEILNVTKSALGLNPAGDVYANFYRAMAFFNLNRLPEAEKSALQAEGVDPQHKQAPVHYLLAQIYEAKGDLASAMAEVKQFMKISPDKQKVEEAKQYLAKLQAQQPGN